MRPYDRLIGAALNGNRVLFARQDTVEAAWRVVDPILDDAMPVHTYPRGSWGPAEADGCCRTARPGTTRSRDPARRRCTASAATRSSSSAAASAACSPPGRCGGAGRRHPGRPRAAPPVPAAALPGGHRDPVRGADRGAAARRAPAPPQRRRACSPRWWTSTSPARPVIATGPNGGRIELPYDDLVLAAGVRQSYFGHDEFARWAPGMKTICGCADDPAQGVRGVRDGRDRRPTPRSGAGGSPSPWSAADPPGSSSPGRSGSSPPAICARSSGTSGPSTPGCCCSTAGTQPLAAFGPALSAKAAATLQDWAWSCTSARRHRRRRRRPDRARRVRGDGATRLGPCCGRRRRGARRSRRPSPPPPGRHRPRRADQGGPDLTSPGTPRSPSSAT